MEGMGQLTGVFALLAAALAGTGVFALVGYIVGQRTREIGIRLALGARSGEVFRAILGDAAVMGGLGSTAGVIATCGMNRVLANRLYGVPPTDPLTLIIATGLLFIICIGACCGSDQRIGRNSIDGKLVSSFSAANPLRVQNEAHTASSSCAIRRLPHC